MNLDNRRLVWELQTINEIAEGIAGSLELDQVLTGALTSLTRALDVAVVPQVSCRPLNFEFQWKAPFPFESLALFHPVSAADRDAAAIAQMVEAGWLVVALVLVDEA